MSRYWEFVAPVAVCGFGAVVLLAHRLRHPAGGHRAGPVTLDATPDTLARWGTVPFARTTGRPPWAPRLDPLPYDMERLPVAEPGYYRSPPPWPPPEAPRDTTYGWVSGSMGTDHALDWAARNELLPPAQEATLRRELHHVDDLQVSGEAEAALPAAGANPTPGNEGAGDESEGSGLTAPPAPLRPVDLALARCDLFMVAMRADHERWLASARERWVAA